MLLYLNDYHDIRFSNSNKIGGTNLNFLSFYRPAVAVQMIFWVLSGPYNFWSYLTFDGFWKVSYE